MARTMDRVQLDQAAIDELAAGFRGEIVRPPDPSYEEHRHVWNGSIDRYPAVIARCAGVADVIAAVRFGHRTGLRVAVRSGGPSFPGQPVVAGRPPLAPSVMTRTRVGPAGSTA